MFLNGDREKKYQKAPKLCREITQRESFFKDISKEKEREVGGESVRGRHLQVGDI